MADSLVSKLRRTCGLVSPEPFQPVSGSGRCGCCRSNSSSQRPALALPDCVVLRSISEMRAIVIDTLVAKGPRQIKAACPIAFIVLDRPSFLDGGGAQMNSTIS